MNYYEIKNDRVTNVIVLNEEQKEWYEETFSCEVENALNRNLTIGDYREGESWYRGVGEEKILVEE